MQIETEKLIIERKGVQPFDIVIKEIGDKAYKTLKVEILENNILVFSGKMEELVKIIKKH